MKIIVNSQSVEITANNLDTVLIELGYEDGRIATAINGDFIPEGIRTKTILNEGDRIEILAPMQGG